MTSALALFGKDSFFYVASNATAPSYPSVTQQICQAGNIPFLRLDGSGGEVYSSIFSMCFAINNAFNEQFVGPGDLDLMLYQWISTFSPNPNGWEFHPHLYNKEALEIAMFFANQHWLLETAKATGILYSARNIYSSPGSIMNRPVIPLWAKIVVSILILLQLYGLARLAHYTLSVPTWTDKFDSCAIAQLTHDVDSGVFSTFRRPNEKDLQELKSLDGLIGVIEGKEESGADSMSHHHLPATDVHTSDVDVSRPDQPDERSQTLARDVDDDIQLARGGSSLITKQHGLSSKRMNFRKLKFWNRRAAKESLLENGDGEEVKRGSYK